MNNPALTDKALQLKEIAVQAIEIKYSQRKGKRSQLEDLAKSRGISLATLYRKMNAYHHGGLEALVHRRAARRYPPKSTDPPAVEFARQLISKNPLEKSSTLLHQLLQAAKERGWRVGSKASLYRLFARLRSDLNVVSPVKVPRAAGNRQRIHMLIDNLEHDQLVKVESYIDYLVGQPRRSSRSKDVIPLHQLRLDL